MAILADNADAVIGVDTRTDTRAGCLLDHLGRNVAEISAALSRSMPRAGGAARARVLRRGLRPARPLRRSLRAPLRGLTPPRSSVGLRLL